MTYSRLNGKALGLALGIIWGASIMLMAWVSLWFHYGHTLVESIGMLYIGYNSSIVGGLIGLAWGFIDFFIFGWLIATLYNIFAKQ